MIEPQLFLEHDLIRQAQSGNSAAYGELYTHHLAAIQHYIQKRVGESADAEDLTQTVFVKAWQALCDYQPSGAPFRAWLYRIAHNAVVDHYRTQRHSLLWDDLTGLADPRDTPEMHSLQRERQATVRNAVAGLRQSYQTVIDQRFLQEMDYGETAEELGQQVNHVRVVQHRALAALRRVLSQENALWLATAVTVLSLLLGGKIVVAAEQALPGDRLYPMRTWVEETSLFLADDANAVELHTRFATQRILALSKLSQQGRTADLATAITAAAAHIRAASVQFAAVPTADRTTLATQLAAALQSQTETLQHLTLAEPQTMTTLQPVLVALSDAQATLHDDATTAPTPTPTPMPQPTATRLLLPTSTPVVVAPVAKPRGAGEPVATLDSTSAATVAAITPTAVIEAQHADKAKAITPTAVIEAQHADKAKPASASATQSHPHPTADVQSTVASTQPTPPPGNAPAQLELAAHAEQHTAPTANEQPTPDHDNTGTASTTHETAATPAPDVSAAAAGVTEHEKNADRLDHHDANGNDAQPSTTTESTVQSQDQPQHTSAPDQPTDAASATHEQPNGRHR